MYVDRITLLLSVIRNNFETNTAKPLKFKKIKKKNNNKLQKVTKSYKKLQKVTKSYKKLSKNLQLSYPS